MKLKSKPITPRKRDIKQQQKEKEDVEESTSFCTQTERIQGKSCLEDLIICQICKDPVEKDHKMCPKCSQIWCTDCISACFRKAKTTKCPNCRHIIYQKSLKKSPLFEKLRELLQKSTVPTMVPESTGCGIHKLPDDFYCKECDILCCSNWALLSDNHKNHSFISLDEIYKIKKDSIMHFQDNLGVLVNKCQNMLESSFQNVRQSKNNLGTSKALFHKWTKAWINEFEAKFTAQLEKQTNSKNSIEELLNETRKQNTNINQLLENPLKNKLIRNFNETVHKIRGVLVKQDNLQVSEVIDGEEIENHFLPKYTLHECAIPLINSETPEGQYLYAPEFVVIKDKFKLGAKVIQNK